MTECGVYGCHGEGTVEASAMLSLPGVPGLVETNLLVCEGHGEILRRGDVDHVLLDLRRVES